MVRYLSVFSLLVLIGCSPNFHYKRIIKKDPGFFRVDTTTTIKVSQREIKPYTVRFKPIPLDTLEFIDIRDSVRVRVITHYDSIEVRADCPDHEIIEVEKKVPEPYPVYVKPSLWEKLKYGLFIFAGFLIFSFLVFIVFRLVRR